MNRSIRRTLLGMFLLLIFIESMLIAPENVDSYLVSEVSGLGKEFKSIGLPTTSPNPANDLSLDPHRVELQGGSINLDSSLPGDQVMKLVHLVESRLNGREWELWAQSAYGMKGEGDWHIQGVKITFFTDDGVRLTVTGKQGDVTLRSKDMKIQGDVRTVTSNGYLFVTDSLRFASSERTLTTDSVVSVWGPVDSNGHRLWLNGKGMSANLVNSHIVVHKDVRGEKIIRDPKILKIQSQQAEFSGQTRQAVFVGDVVMDVGTLHITGPRSEFRYKSESSELDSVLVQGGVRVTDLDKWVTSETLEVQLDEDRFTFTGKPRLVQNQDEIIGSQIIFFEGGDRVEVTGGTARFQKGRLEKMK